MADINKSLQKLYPIEGGYVNDKTDRGGETYRGITRVNWPKWRGWIIIDALKAEPGFPKNLANHPELMEMVPEVYVWYWNSIGGPELESQDIADELFDTAVNTGPVVAVRIAQQALNFLNKNGYEFADMEVDGKMGPKTLSLINGYKYERSLLKALNALQGHHYINLVLKDPTQEKFFRGWLERC